MRLKLACAAAAMMFSRAGSLMHRTSCGIRRTTLQKTASLSTEATRTKDVAKLHYIDFNPGQSIEQSTPVVIMHGLLGNSRNFQTWGANLVKLLDKQRRVFAVDMRNHGASSHHASMTYPEMAEDIAAFMQERGLSKAVLLGHSMGGKVIVNLACITEPCIWYALSNRCVTDKVLPLLLLDVAKLLCLSGVCACMT
jgi:pimeloyl-ACP methyl ester carboxylesterase